MAGKYQQYSKYFIIWCLKIPNKKLKSKTEVTEMGVAYILLKIKDKIFIYV